MTPVDHFAAFCETLTQSEDSWEGQPTMKLEPWQRRFWRDALGDWRSVVLIVARQHREEIPSQAHPVAEVGDRHPGKR